MMEQILVLSTEVSFDDIDWKQTVLLTQVQN